MKASYFTFLLMAAGSAVEGTPVENEKRAEMTVAQNWCVAGGAALTGVGAIAAGIAALIAASNMANSCNKKSAVVHNKFKRHDFDTASLTEVFVRNGVGVEESHWQFDEGTRALRYPYEARLGQYTKLGNLTLSEDGSVYSEVIGFDPPDSLERRDFPDFDPDILDWSHSKVAAFFHASGHCRTSKSMAEVHAAVKQGLSKMSDNKHEAACYALNAGGAWTGHLKVLEVTENFDFYSKVAKAKACNGSIKVKSGC